MLNSQFLIVVFVLLVGCYFFFGKRYRQELIEKYGYDFMGIPAIIAIAGPVINTLMVWGGSGPEEPGIVSIVLRMLLFATPGVVIAAIRCFAKTRNSKITLINVLLLYFVAVVVGGAIAVLIMAVIAFIALKVFASRASSIVSGTDEGGVCPNCGTRVSGPGRCPGCDTDLR
jgi:hypothetical protein